MDEQSPWVLILGAAGSAATALGLDRLLTRWQSARHKRLGLADKWASDRLARDHDVLLAELASVRLQLVAERERTEQVRLASELRVQSERDEAERRYKILHAEKHADANRYQTLVIRAVRAQARAEKQVARLEVEVQGLRTEVEELQGYLRKREQLGEPIANDSQVAAK